MKIFNRSIHFSALPAFLLGFVSTVANAAPLSLPDDPLFVGSNVPPNIMFIQDDSGSMHRENMPDIIGALPFDSLSSDIQSRYQQYWAAYNFPRLVNGLYGDRGTGGALDKPNVVPDFSRRNIFGAIHRSSDQNGIAYNPNKTYQPWSNADGTLMAQVDPACAPHNPSINPIDDPDRPLDCGDSTKVRALDSTNSHTAYWWRAKQINCAEYGDRDNDGVSESGDSGKKEPEGLLLGCDDPEDGSAPAAKGFDMYFRSGRDSYYPAYYTVFNTAGGKGDYKSPRLNPANYTHRYITASEIITFDSANQRSTSPTIPHDGNRSDCVSTVVCDANEELKNFANWYSYHRSRLLLSRAGIGRAFADLDDSTRVGFGTLNTFVDGEQTVISLPVRKFDSDGKSLFFDTLYNLKVPENGTPLRRALQAAGEYYSDGSSTGPWADESGAIQECRRSYTILMSDGVWNGGNPSLPTSNVDGASGPIIASDNGDPNYQYTPQAPYSDTHGSTLADVAMYYWNRDLLPGVANKIDVEEDDPNPAFWQNMTTYTVGLGVSGELKFPGDLDLIKAGSKSWPNPLASRLNRIDDLWHAAVNGRGQFLSAADSESFAAALTDALQAIGGDASSSGSAAANSGALTNDTRVYQASFDPEDWSGNVRALPADRVCDDLLCGTEIWSAAEKIDAQGSAGRRIITSVGGTGVEFTRSDTIDPFLSSPLADEDSMLAFLRGDDTLEGEGGLRERGSALGDITNAGPVFEGVPSRIRYPIAWEDKLVDGGSVPETSYASFRSAKAGRTPMLFVGANDGMLHVIDANTGNELMAYVPEAVLPNIKDLADPAYNHRPYVDATPATSDAFYNSSWHTVLVGGLGKGGQAVYALDVTGGSGYFSGTAPDDIALWEFTHQDLGYLYGKPAIVRLHNGTWAAVFGNGYNNSEADGSASTTGTASLFVVNIADGSLLAQIDTKKGSVGTPNGISEVSPVDIDGDFITDYIYAGDLQGNMWKFDLTSDTPANWRVGFGSSTTPAALFEAKIGEIQQPITAPARVRQHPFGLEYGVIVYFGTGKYVETGDASPNTSQTQSFYGIWDMDFDPTRFGLVEPAGFTRSDISIRNGFARGNLQQQQILAETSGGGGTVRIVSDNPSATRHLDWLGGIRGFYLDLKVAGRSNEGEIVITPPALRGDLLTFNTLIPDGDDCNASPRSFLMALDAATGGRLYMSPFDLNDDNQFNDGDRVDYGDGDDGVYVSGLQTGKATTGAGVFLVNGDADDVLINRIDETIERKRVNRLERNGRRAWRELRRQ